jgi:hypothetical protein
MIKFDEASHTYLCVDPSKDIRWTSVTSLVGLFKPSFDRVAASEKASKNPRSKWFGIDPKKIQQIWKDETSRSTEAGKWYHYKRETELTTLETLDKDGVSYTITKPSHAENFKLAPVQKLQNNTIYPEYMVYSMTDQICGQSDKVEVLDNKVSITDYKTIKALKTEGFTNWEGLTQRMQKPIDHLDDCHLVHYTLQLSLYLYMILKHNPQFKPGILNIEHIKFKLESMDEYGFPIYFKDNNNQFVVDEITNYKVPYMKEEVLAILNEFKNNKEEYFKKIDNNKH